MGLSIRFKDGRYFYLENKNNKNLKDWAKEIWEKGVILSDEDVISNDEYTDSKVWYGSHYIDKISWTDRKEKK